MPGRRRLFRGSRPSAGGRQLARRLGIPALKREGSRYQPRPTDTILNWGSSKCPGLYVQSGCAWINHPDAVATAANKLLAFDAMSLGGVPLPVWSAGRHVAEQWQAEGHVVMVRHKLTGSCGDGIQVVEPDEELPNAPLYTQYFKGTNEYRIHVANGVVFDRQMKRRRRDERNESAANTRVRNLAGGWVFCREEVVAQQLCDQAAAAAVSALGLDFGAVDIKANKQHTRVAVLEVNTAPGLEGSTGDLYEAALKGLIAV